MSEIHSQDHSDNELDSDFEDAIDNLNINNNENDQNILNIEKDLNKALEAKEKGNEFFRLKQYDESIQEYSLAIAHCPLDDKDNLGTFYGNRSAAYYAEEEWKQAVIDCTESLKLKPDYIKVLVRKAQSHEKLEQYDEALTGN